MAVAVRVFLSKLLGIETNDRRRRRFRFYLNYEGLKLCGKI